MRRPDVIIMQCHILFLFVYNGWDWPWDYEEERRLSDAASPSLSPVIDRTAGKPECSDCFCRPCGLDETHQQLWWPDHSPSRKKSPEQEQEDYRP